MSYLSKISTTTDVNWKQKIWFFTKSSAISPKVLNLFAFIDCNKGMSSLIRVVLEISKNGQCLYYRNVLFQLMYNISPRFLCRSTTFYIIARAVERQSAIYTENSGFASPTLGQHISTFRGYRILFSIRNPYIYKSLHQSFFYSFITILPSESGVTLHYSTILP